MAKNYILNVKDTNGNWVPLQTLVGPKGDQGAQGPVGIGIKSITKENENLINHIRVSVNSYLIKT